MMQVMFRKLFRDARGATATEYGLLSAVLALPVLVTYLAINSACAGAMQGSTWTTANPVGMSPQWVCLGSYGECGAESTPQ